MQNGWSYSLNWTCEQNRHLVFCVACCCVCCACMSCSQQGTDSQEQRRQWIRSIPLERALFNPKIPYNIGELALLSYVHAIVCSIVSSSHLSPGPCPSAAGCSPPPPPPTPPPSSNPPSIVLCLLLSCSRWFPPSLLCRLAIFYLVFPLISSLSLVATLCNVWSTYCPSFLLYVRPISTFVSERILCQLSLFLSWSLGMVYCRFRLNIFLSLALLSGSLSIVGHRSCWLGTLVHYLFLWMIWGVV